MSNIYRITVLFVLTLFITACTAPVASTPVTNTQPPANTPPLALPEFKIARHPAAADFREFNVYTELPTYDPNSTEQWQVDLRSADLTKLDLSKSKEDLLFADFDSKTKWPAPDKMPADFDWQEIMETGKDPGLGVRELHKQGVNGENIGIAIIDQTLLVDHIEYIDRLRLYEEPVRRDRGMVARMHGPAVASIAVGKTTGVAPEADLYYIAAPSCFGADDDFTCTAQIVRHVIEINRSLPAGHKIRVLSISVGWGTPSKGYAEMMAAVEEAEAAGIFVISSSLSMTHGLSFHGLGRESLSTPNEFESYQPGLWWQEYLYKNGLPANTLLVPMDSRTTASPTGIEDYVFYREGGWSWSIPYLAGTYALAAQVKPDITPEEFWGTALETGRTIQIQHDGKDYEFGVILDPQALIEAIKNE